MIFLILILLLFIITGCQSDPTQTYTEPETPIRRLIISYVCADNNISNPLQNDIYEMISGSKNLASDCRLVVFADHLRNSTNNGHPYIAEIKNGQKTIIRQYDNDFYCTSPDSLRNIIQWIIDKYPAEEYALLMSGHGTGSITSIDTLEHSLFTKLYAYGYDAAGEVSATSEYKYINIPSLNLALSQLHTTDGNPIHFEYMFIDCCCMMTAEVAYELRNITDYFIAPASEVPGEGAPYNYIVPILSSKKSDIGQNIIDTYINHTNWGTYGGVAISTVKMSEMEPLMRATRKALQNIYSGERLNLSISNCVYYYRGYGVLMNETSSHPALYDIKNIMQINLSNNSYDEWLKQFNKTVITKYTPTSPWDTSIGINFYSFTISEDNYGCMGMIVPNDMYDDSEKRDGYPSLNKTMFTLSWTNDIGWHSLGW